MLQISCAATTLAGYAIAPNYPEFSQGETLASDGIHAPVVVFQDDNGLWHIEAENESDLMFMTGYLQARDRMAQMDIFRKIAKGRVSQLVGVVPFGGKTSAQLDLFNQALGFETRARQLFDATAPEEQKAMLSFAAGVNAWLAHGPLPLEHRLLGVDTIEPWSETDSLSIYAMLMFNLSSNYNREIRRLALACEAGLDASLRIWPTDINFQRYALPAEHQRAATHTAQPSVVAEVRDTLPELCRDARQADPVEGTETVAAPSGLIKIASWVEAFETGWSASNSWVVSGKLTASGKPILANDPHLPHMNPPIVWGLDQQSGDYRTVGFTLPGIHRVVFGHNGSVSWGATTNHVDRQDLAVLKPAGSNAYEVDGESFEYERRSFTIKPRGADAQTFTVRYTRNGPVINDLDPSLPARIPLTELRHAALGEAADLMSARELAYARHATDFVKAIRKMDSGCTNWVYADTQGNIGYESPCRLPIREGYDGSFPVAGWLSKYDWKGYVAKEDMPASRNPERGWLATANSRMIPVASFPTAYNNDPSEPHRYLRAKQLIEAATEGGGSYLTSDAVEMQSDTVDWMWPQVRQQIEAPLCSAEGRDAKAVDELCAWNGDMTSDSQAATLYVGLTNFLLDRALTDDLPEHSDELWKFVQNIPMFEANAQWLWLRPATDAVWDDVRTSQIESKADIIQSAFADSLAWMDAQYGDDAEARAWGEAARFRIRHLFAGKDGLLGGMLNSEFYPGSGAPSTLYKNQFHRADRTAFQPAIGPSVRFVVDMANPWAGVFTLAGGESGWPSSPHYADQTSAWRNSEPRRLTPDGDGGGDGNGSSRKVLFEPGGSKLEN